MHETKDNLVEKIDEDVWKQAVTYVRRLKGRHRTLCRRIERDRALLKTALTPPTPHIFLFARKQEDTYSDRFEMSTRQEWTDIQKMAPSKRRKLYLYIGMLLTEWLGETVTLVDSTSYSLKHTKWETFLFDLRQKR